MSKQSGNRILQRLPSWSDLLVLCLAGTLLRLLYATFFAPWTHLPDHLAWELMLSEAFHGGSLHYNQLMHYPHENGSLLIGLLALPFKALGSNTALAIAIAILDVASRLVQLWVVKRVFGKPALWLFGLWSLFALPALLPWATGFSGMHALASCFPFLLVYMGWQPATTSCKMLLHGALLGLGVWFSWSNTALVPVFVLMVIFTQQRWRYLGIALAGAVLVAAPLLGINALADTGFHLGATDGLNIRGLDLTTASATWMERLQNVWIEVLANATMLPELAGISKEWVRTSWVILLGVGALALIGRLWLKQLKPTVGIAFLVAVVFIVQYALSPFYHPVGQFENYVDYRHLAYIFPLLAVLAIAGFQLMKVTHALLPIFLLPGFCASYTAFQAEPKPALPDNVVGWVLGPKLGHDSDRILLLANSGQYDHDLLLEGVGWGVTSTLFSSTPLIGTELNHQRIAEWQSWMASYPDSVRPALAIGAEFAFSPYVTPQLNQSIRHIVLPGTFP